MKKYKLIKKYPSSPKLGSIIERTGTENGLIYELRLHPGKCQVFTKCEIENYPEYWEEVVEKDYEILSVISTKYNNLLGEGQLHKIESPSKYTHKNNREKYAAWNIHSVKRLSDGEIFTVGDLVKRPHYKQPFKINHIHIAGDMIWLHSKPFVEETCSHVLDEHTTLREAIKYKQPLFTTEDGVDIFENDQYFWIIFKDNKEICSSFAFDNSKDGKRNVLYFSTEEAANEYIKKNKIVFTTEDNVKITKSDYSEIYGVALQASASDMLRKGYTEGIGEYELPYPNRKWFKYKENAEEYILMNKPCLSINDVKQKLINGCDKYPSKTNGSRTLKLLIELVKSKL